jgi:Flp pilus assembly pilin Flp
MLLAQLLSRMVGIHKYIRLYGLLRDRRAVTSIEYSLIALIIVTALITSTIKIGPELVIPFNNVSSEL